MIQFIKEKKSASENIAFVAILCALNVVFSFLIYFFITGGLLALLVIPLISAIATLYCKKRYVIVYFFSSLLLSIIVCGFDFMSVLLFIFPSLVVGTLFGILKKNNVSKYTTIFVASLANLTLTYFSFFIIKLVYEIDIQNVVFQITSIRLLDDEKTLLPSIVFIYSLCEVLIAYFSLSIFGEKLKITEVCRRYLAKTYFLIALIILMIVIVFSFFSVDLTYLFSLGLIYFSSVAFLDEIQRLKIQSLLVLGAGLLLSFIILVTCYSIIEEPYNNLLLLAFPLSFGIAGFFNQLYTNRHKE